VILGQCELLLLDELDPAVRESLETMLKAGEHTRAIVSRLLDLARGQEAQKQLCDLNQLVTDSLQLIRRQFMRHHVELDENLDPGLPLVEAHAGQIQQVIINLVQNSRDALLASGLRGRIKVRTTFADGRVTLQVEDDGPGIPAAVRDRIFEPFFTTKANGKGTGLGLSVCRNIAHEHGGYLYAETPSRGTLMVLSLPVADASALTALN
jgi:two-component system NtrC family sensor kinase